MKKIRIAIVDYGAGNIGSVSRALSFLGAEPFLAKTAEGLRTADAIVLPGVGSFSCARNLQPLREELLLQMKEKPFLGICLGMQLLFETSEEAEGARGLGVYPGKIGRLACKKVPHVGWNTLEVKCKEEKAEGKGSSAKSNSLLLAGAESSLPAVDKPGLLEGVEREAFYFCHSYAVKECADAAAKTEVDGIPFVSAIENGKVCAVQFHPEKSGKAGLRVLKNFLDMVKK
jgi:imidazoleglycerol phosphate synthase glutamine amidotransferase subunit HisH